jgi:hypothetical protein
MKDEIRTFRARKLIIIDSLKDTDWRSGELLAKGLIEKNLDTFKIEHAKVKSKDEMLTLLGAIDEQVKTNIGVPMLHFTMHGNEDGIELASGEFMDWGELAPAILKINISSANNLFITMASCFGFFVANLAAEVTHYRSVFWCILGRQDKYSGGDFTNDYLRFYTELCRSSHLGDALKLIDNDRKEYKIYNSEYLFLSALKIGFRTSMRQEIEKLVRKNHIRAKREGKKSPVPKSKMPEVAFNLFKKG